MVDYRKSAYVLSRQTPNFHSSLEDTCTVWYDRNTGAIKAVDPNYDPHPGFDISVELKYSQSMAEPVLVDPKQKVGKVLQSVLDKIRTYREKHLDQS